MITGNAGKLAGGSVCTRVVSNAENNSLTIDQRIFQLRDRTLAYVPSTSEPPLILFCSLQISNAERKCLERLAAFPFSRAFKRLDRSRLVNMDNGVKLI